MKYQQFIEMVIRNVAGVDTSDTKCVIQTPDGKRYAIADVMTWDDDPDDTIAFGPTIVIHADWGE